MTYSIINNFRVSTTVYLSWKISPLWIYDLCVCAKGRLRRKSSEMKNCYSKTRFFDTNFPLEIIIVVAYKSRSQRKLLFLSKVNVHSHWKWHHMDFFYKQRAEFVFFLNHLLACVSETCCFHFEFGSKLLEATCWPLDNRWTALCINDGKP